MGDTKHKYRHQSKACQRKVTVHWLFGIHLVRWAAAVSHFMFRHVADD